MQVHPQEYNADMVSILGFVLKHDDSVNDRSENSKLNNADEVGGGVTEARALTGCVGDAAAVVGGVQVDQVTKCSFHLQ